MRLGRSGDFGASVVSRGFEMKPNVGRVAAHSRSSVAFGLDNSSVTDGGDARLLRQLIRPTDAAGEPSI